MRFRDIESLYNKIYNKIYLTYFHVDYSPSKVGIQGRLKVINKGTLIIGDDVRINSGLKHNPIGGQDGTILISLHPESKLIIGSGTAISNSAIVAHEEIIIGDHVMIGGGCRIYDTDFHSIYYDQRIGQAEEIVKTRPVKIGEGAFIGAGVIITKGVTIGKRSVIAAGSVVVKNIGDDQVWGGNPAKFIKSISQVDEV